MVNFTSVTEVAAILKNVEDVAVIFHKNPDGDAIGSAVALCLGLKQLHKRCKILTFNKIPDRFNFMLSECVFDNFENGFVVAVDLASLNLLEEKLCDVKVNLVIDHHINNSVNADYCFVNDKAAANCELIFCLLNSLNVKLTKQIAMSLYVGLATDTGCFKFSNTTSKTHEIASKLISFGFDFYSINFNLFDVKTKSQLQLQSLIIQNLHVYLEGWCSFVVVTQSMLLQCGCDEADLFIAVDLARSIEGVQVALILKELANFNFKVSVRAIGGFNAYEFCKLFGGGGHLKAAGFEISGKLQTVKLKILNKLKEFVVERNYLH